MSSKKYAAPLQLELHASKILFTVLLFLHTLAIVALMILPFSIWLRLLLSVVIALIGMYLIAVHAMRSADKSINKIVWDANDGWLISSRIAENSKMILLGDSFIHPLLTVLRFKQQKKNFATNVVLLKDNIDENEFRRLRVRLKLSRNSAET